MRTPLTTRRLYLASLLLLCFFVIFAATRSSTLARPQAFTVEMVVRMTGAEGPETELKKLYVSREDGAFLAKTFSREGTISVISLPTTREQVSIDHQRGNRMTIPIRSDEMLDAVTYRKYSGANCSQVLDGAVYVRDEQFLGIAVAVFGSGEVLPSQSRYREIWKMAPSLNCFPLYRDIIWVDGAGRITAQTRHTATSVVAGPPASILFDVPANLKEMKPSDFFLAREGESALSPSRLATLRAWDSVYERANRQ